MTVPAIEPQVDFETAGTVAVGTRDELVAFFADRGADSPPVRICGAASRQREVPAPDGRAAPVLLCLAQMTRVPRLEPGDLTCSVEPGLRRADLDELLANEGLRLPCEPTTGTLGGLFALGQEAHAEAPGTLGSIGARTLLLGMSGVLPEGKPFKSGGRVVKNVAGFDLQKLFIGSRGRLFAATELHLKLKPLPRASAAFEVGGLELGRALELFGALRLDEWPPAAVRLLRRHREDTFMVSGRFEGAARVVADRMRAHGLEERPDEARALDEPESAERLVGLVPPSRITELVALLPERSPLRVGGTGRFEAFFAGGDADRVLEQLPGVDAVAELDLADPARRGRATPRDPGAVRIEQDLKAALDPGDVLT